LRDSTLFDLLEELMKKEKPFLYPDLNREEVAREKCPLTEENYF